MPINKPAAGDTSRETLSDSHLSSPTVDSEGAGGNFGHRDVRSAPDNPGLLTRRHTTQQVASGVSAGEIPADKVSLVNRKTAPVSGTLRQSVSLPDLRMGREDFQPDKYSLDLRDNLFLLADNRTLRTIQGDSLKPPQKFKFKEIANIVRNVNAAASRARHKPLLSDHVLIGIEKVASYENQGIPLTYLEKTQTVANNENVIIAIRPVEKICRTLIEEGYASKGLNIKGKSANWGPMAGFIPVDQHFSKVSGDVEKEKKYSEINKATLLKGEANQEQLHLSSKRINELTALGILKETQDIASFGNYKEGMRFSAKPANGPAEFFEAHRREDGQWDIFSGSEDKRQQLMVIPVSADFDLLFVHSHFDHVDLGTHDRMQEFDHELGLVSKRKREIIDALNNAFGRGEGKNMVHHGADTQNPVTDIDANLPATVFIPETMVKKMSIYTESPILVKTHEELSKLYRAMKHNGMRVETNPLWDELRAVAHEDINKKIEQFGASPSIFLD